MAVMVPAYRINQFNGKNKTGKVLQAVQELMNVVIIKRVVCSAFMLCAIVWVTQWDKCIMKNVHCSSLLAPEASLCFEQRGC